VNIRINFTSPETRGNVLPMLKTAWMFIPLDKTPERDGRIDGQTAGDYYSGLHCEQCGRAVKNGYLLQPKVKNRYEEAWMSVSHTCSE